MPEDKRMNTWEEIVRINRVRGSIYSFLSRAFKTEIDADFLNDIVAGWPTIKLLSESQERPDLIEGSKRLGQFVQNVAALGDDRKEDLMTELRAEFTNLFIGIGDDAVLLVESAYLEERNSKYEKPAQDVKAAYQSIAFKKDAEFCEGEDHLVLEFEFMARMCDWTAQALRTKDHENAIAYLSLQKEFARDHVVRWVPKLCERLKRKAKSDFYTSLAYIASGFVEMDYEMPDHLTAILRSKLSEGALH